MSGDEHQNDEHGSDENSTEDKQDTSAGETPELSDEGKKQVEEMQQAYDDDRETAVLPGTDNTITGVAVNNWLDDDGNPKYGKDEQGSDNADGDHKDDSDHKDEAASDAG